MLEELKKTYVDAAQGVPWESMNKNDLFNLYIKNEDDEVLANKYFAAIVCRYWYLIFTNYEKSKNSVDIYTCYEWVTHAVLSVLRRRAWLNPESTVYNDPNGPDKCLNQSVCSHRLGFYQSSNTDKKRTNYNTVSCEELYETFGESSKALREEEPSYTEDVDDIESLVTNLVSHNRLLEALIIDNIVYGECFKSKTTKAIGHMSVNKTIVNEDGDEEEVSDVEEYKYDKVNHKFSQKMLNSSLRDLDDSYSEYFSEKYLTDKNCILDCIGKIKGMTNSQLNKVVKKMIVNLSQDSLVLSYLS